MKKNKTKTNGVLDYPKWVDLPLEFWDDQELKEWLLEIGIK